MGKGAGGVAAVSRRPPLYSAGAGALAPRVVREERAKAEIAAGELEAWAAGGDAPAASAALKLRSKEVASRLGVSWDTLRSWK